MKKDKTWLKQKIHKELESWQGVEGGIDGDGINEIMLLINELNKTETLSSDWIDENKKYTNIHDIGYYIPVNKLYGKIVSNKEEVDQAYKDGYDKGIELMEVMNMVYEDGEFWENEKMKKGTEWLKEEVWKQDIVMDKGYIYTDDLMSIIDEVDETEVKRLERKIKELDSYNDELVRDNNQLRNELDSLDSQFMVLHTSYDEQIKSLEYELFVEKTREPKNKFYWFTAKKTPLIVDISYMSNENHFYGFKQVPNYHFIENHDLRFITNCSLDDLVEQFR